MVYKIVHRLPDGTERHIATVDKRWEVAYHVDKPQFAGTWLSDNQKLLRYGLGMLEIVEDEIPPSIDSNELVREFGTIRCKLKVINHDEIGWLLMSPNIITAYDHSYSLKLWDVDNFAALAVKLDKGIAYKAMQIYEELNGTVEFNGTM